MKRSMSRSAIGFLKPIANTFSIHRLSSSTTTTNHITSNSNQSDGEGSSVYQHSKKYSRPSTVTWSERLQNSVSFIGTIDYPVTRVATKNDTFGAYTCLRVSTSPHSHSYFSVLLSMWDEMALKAIQHLKQNDYVYVSGQLGSYTKNALQGIEKLRYKVIVKELNFISRSEPKENIQRVVKSEFKLGESGLDKCRTNLHLWQVFFANPNDWHDNRKTKKMPKYPDFKHKTTGEALWLHPNDPPWIHKQLELLDSRHTEEPNADDPACKSLSRWFYGY